ncbi:MAG: hypothetical protein HUJ18_14365 [Marinobacter sp.]|nr:hypothetical protein [Marinobacter sp.]
MKREHTGAELNALLVSGLILLSAPGLAGAHGAPEADEIPDGFVKASITSYPDIQGLSALVLDAPRPGIMLRYRGSERLTVIGTEGEKFLRFTRDTVEVNIASASWKKLPNAPRLADNAATRADPSGPASWRTLSRSGSFSWLDPRLNGQRDGPARKDAGTWSIAVETAAGNIDHIRGTLSFKPIQ